MYASDYELESEAERNSGDSEVEPALRVAGVFAAGAVVGRGQQQHVGSHELQMLQVAAVEIAGNDHLMLSNLEGERVVVCRSAEHLHAMLYHSIYEYSLSVKMGKRQQPYPPVQLPLAKHLLVRLSTE